MIRRGRLSRAFFFLIRSCFQRTVARDPLPMTSTLAAGDAKAPIALGLLVDHVDPVDPRSRWSLTAPPDHGVDGGGVPFEGRFDGAVVTVAHPTGHAGRRRSALAVVPEEDPLHASGHDDPLPHGHGVRLY
jgi:hypothetical protein